MTKPTDCTTNTIPSSNDFFGTVLIVTGDVVYVGDLDDVDNIVPIMNLPYSNDKESE